MADSSDQSSGFWTLTRPNKLTKRRNSDLHELHHKVFNIAVVGLSGTEKEKGPIGIGKSCLCNRFITSAADDYHTDHISVLSQSDFGGRIVNNDHWLYWGSVIKTCDGYDLAFNIIEQTEFVDDVCFQPFKSGKTDPYYKRCANTKLVSPEKLMYICKNQLGIEREYEQRYLPDGKFNVDGFLCLFDVSEVQGRNIDKQIEMTNLIMLNLIKSRKPVVFVTTKHDEANEVLVAEAERLVNQRDFRGLVPIVETSAQDNVNINMAFLACAQLIDKTRAKLRVAPYFEAHKTHVELLNAASNAYLNLIRSTVLDYRSSWQQVCIKLSHNPEFLQYTYLHGLDKAAIAFKTHVRRLHEECISQKVQHFLKIFPDILNEMIPQTNRSTTNQLNNNNEKSAEYYKQLDQLNSSSSPEAWEFAKHHLKSHPLFSKYFIQVPEGISWYDTELLQTSEQRIPSDWLDSEEAYAIFQQRNIRYETEQQRQSTKEIFAQMLVELKIPVGKPFIELKHIFANNQSLELLSDQELFEIYVEYQNNLLQQARSDFQELLLENAEHFHHLTSSDKVIRQEDIKTINAILQHDERYQALDRFDQDRTLMMIRHLSFLHSQISEQCPSYPSCIEPEIERLLITKAKSLVSRYYDNKPGKASSGIVHSQKTCDLVIFGPRRPSQQLILALNVLNSRAPKSTQYQITFTVFDNTDELDNQLQRFRQSNTKPRGCFGIFTNRRSLEHVSFTLEKFLILSSQMQNNQRDHFGSPPIVMLYAADITLDERTMLALENEGQQVADRFKCPFMNVTAIDQYRQHQQSNLLNNEQQQQQQQQQDSTSQVLSECASLDYACVDAAFNVLKEAISRRVCFMELYNNQDLIPRQAFNPDARILMCILCGEPFSNEIFLWKMFLDYEDCYVTSSKSICLRVKLLDGQEKFIEVLITSYTHGAFNYKEDLLHGFILVCSTQRKASLAILNAFSFNIPCTPVLIMAVNNKQNNQPQTSNQPLDVDEVENLTKESRDVANRLKGHHDLVELDLESSSGQFLANSKQSLGIGRIGKFLQSVIERKPAIERAYELGDGDVPTLMPTSSIDHRDIIEEEQLVAKPRSKVNSNKSRQFLSNRNKYSSDDDLIESSNGCGNNEQVPVSSSPATTSSFVAQAQIQLQSQQQKRQQQQQPQPRPRPLASNRRFVGVTSSEVPLESQSPVVATAAANISNKISQPNELYAKRPLPPIPVSSVCSSATEAQIDSIHQETPDRGTLQESTPLAPPLPSSRQHPTPEISGFGQHKNAENSKKESDEVLASSRQQVVNTSGDDELDDSSTDDTEDSADNANRPPKPGRLDLRQFDNITTAIGKLNVSTAATTITTSSSPLVSSSHTTNPTSSMNIKSSIETTTLNNNNNARRLQKNPRQNHGRAVAPPKLPPTSNLLEADNNDKIPANDQVAQLSNQEDNSAIDFSQSPIAQRLLKHSKDHKVSELNSPYESENELNVSQNLTRSYEIHKVRENVSKGIIRNSSIDSSELINSRGAAIRQLNEILANKQPPGRPGGPKQHLGRVGSTESDQQQVSGSNKKSDKDKDNKKDKKKLRSDEKLEKRKLKEEERLRRQEEEKQRRQEKKLASKKSKSGSSNSNSIGDDGIPLFIKRCIEFIEFEGLDAEGLYRVPGNRAHVDAFVQKFKDNPNMSIVESDVPVNAVATALKDFLSKKWGPIIPLNQMNELTELSNIPEKEKRIEAVRDLIHMLPAPNYRLLKYVFSHFVKVSLNHSLNSMDSKNLAICWWPTLLPLHFNDMVMFEQMRPHLEESIQTMIDQYDFIFDTDDPSGSQ